MRRPSQSNGEIDPDWANVRHTKNETKELKPGGACIVSASCTEYKCQDIDSGRFREKRLAMSYIQSVRMNAPLADAVYRDLPIGVIDRGQLENEKGILSNRMTPQLAKFMANGF